MTRRLLAPLTAAALLLSPATALPAHAMPAHAVPAVVSAAAGRTIVVSPGGPMTIQQAVNRLGHGGTVELTAGRYHQRVRFVHAHGITLRPAKGAHAVLDGSGLTPPAGQNSAMVTIYDSARVRIEGLEITVYRTSRLNTVPIGVYVHGHDQDIAIVGNHVHDLGNYNGTLGSFDINAHGIAVYGDQAAHPVTRLTISGNTVDHLHLGASETVVVNGNVTHWSIDLNHIYADNNIGIDAIGFEPTLPGAYRYTDRNRARYGLIAHNTVSTIRSKGNPAYWEDGSWCNCADGIYVDGGMHIRIVDNKVSASDIGIEVAAENGRGSAEHVLVARNVITGSLYVGLTTGGYCNGAKACGGVQTGSSHDNVFRANTLRGNNQLDDGSPELLVQYHAYRDSFEYNTIVATDRDHVVYGTVPQSDSHDNHSDHNSFAARGATRAQAQFGWDGRTYTGFGTYRAATGQDAHSRFGAGK